MKKKRNFLLKSILLQLNFSLEKAGILLVLVLVFSIQAKAYSQTRITAKRQGVTIDEVLKEVREKSGYRFLYRVEEVNRYGKRDIDVKDAEVEDFLGQLLQNTDLTYEVENEVIIIRPEKQRQDSRVNVQVVRGKVTDENNLALPGATVLLKGTSYGVVTDSHGKFTMEVLERDTVTLLVSFVGMETRLVNLKKGQTEILVSLEPDIKEMKEVVVTGYGNVRKTSFTGNSVTVTKDELMSVSKSNVIKALQTFDPSFRIQTNNDWGSDPNALPEMYVRGRSGISGVKELDRDPLTKSALKDNPNLPTFIMDGFQISVEQLYDMDPNRIESITILKDAAATALYGSRAANGVVVITTVAPQMGKLNVSYNFTGDVTVPDLSDYNLMNAREKLETEVAAGVFEDLAKDNPLGAEQQYYAKLASITRGVDTYWLSKPLQTSFNHKHSLSVDGGSDNFRFGIQLSYNNEDGVMKESFRNRVGAGVYLDYRIGSFQLKNMVTYTNTRSQESPYGAFSDYTRCQPYDPYKDDKGNYLENLPNWDGKNAKRPNPLYESTLSNFDKSKYEEFVDNLGINWNITTGLLWKTQFSLTRKITDTKRFLDPLSSKNTTPQTAENPSSGELNTSRGNEFYWDLSSTLSYNRSVEKHHINLLLGVNARSAKTDNISASYRGFPSGALSSPNYAEEIVSKPVSSDNSTRLIGFLGTLNYSYNDVYLLDASVRMDGSSEFGADKRFAPFWSAGTGVNIHNYGFMKGQTVIDQLKIRVSYGQTGKVNFPPYVARTTYKMFTDGWYKTGFGGTLYALGNTNLTWETTNTWDAGVELSLWKRLLYIKASYYQKKTVDLVNEQNDVASGLDLTQQTLDPLLELAAELGAGHEAGQIQQEDLLILQTHRDIALGDALRDALGDGRLADARLTDKAGVVLLAAAQDLDGAVNLAVAAHDVVELALPGFTGQVLTVGVEEFAAGRLFAVLLGLFAVSGIALRLDAQREGGAGAGDKVVVPFVLLAAHGLAHIHHEGEGVRVPHLIHHALHPVFHIIHVLVGHTELLHQVFHRLDVQLTRTVQAKALIFHLAILHPLDEDDGRTFLTAIADHIGSS